MRIAGAGAGLFVLLAACNPSSHSAMVSEGSPDATSAFKLALPFGPDPPRTACDADAAFPCPTPPWACTDAGAVAVIYDNGQCVSGFCIWEKYDTRCTPGFCADPGTGDAMIEAGPDGLSAPDGSVWAVVNACVVPVPAGPDPPETPCDVDASVEGGVCPPPPSVCANSNWLVYYDDGRCVAGQCVWQKERTPCPAAGGCFGGRCNYLGTSAAAPN